MKPKTLTLREMFELQIKKTKEIIKKYDSILPICIIVDKDFSLKVIGFAHRNQYEKEMLKQLLKKIILSNKNLLGYMLFMDTKMTTMAEKPVVKDAVVSLLCSPKLTFHKAIIYDNKTREIIEEIVMYDSEIENQDIKNYSSEWDVYGKSFDDIKNSKEINESYQKFKEENPELFKGI